MSGVDRNITIDGLFALGLKTRKEVLGAEYVNKSLQNGDPFMEDFQRITTEFCWGYGWNRKGLDRKVRSLINLSMLCALGKTGELELHVKGAIRNGCTIDEIKEVLIQATIYCGIPAGLNAFKAAKKALGEIDEN
ncbi:MAG: carboxymuconolactone decarboxylase family protein [Candidatus Cloacimonetes bacterium]|nr:carboxymuconolactone decarboxylase family protein [Candidatus Cloacimonadota bacterium]MCK9515603.1 carboxymuconolactone decarboxylase family protein [Ottowia sp.]